MSRTTADTQPKEPRGWYRHTIAPSLPFDPSPRVETEAARRDREWEQEKSRLRQMGADL